MVWIPFNKTKQNYFKRKKIWWKFYKRINFHLNKLLFINLKIRKQLTKGNYLNLLVRVRGLKLNNVNFILIYKKITVTDLFRLDKNTIYTLFTLYKIIINLLKSVISY